MISMIGLIGGLLLLTTLALGLFKDANLPRRQDWSWR
jgi:hypothetical protein